MPPASVAFRYVFFMIACAVSCQSRAQYEVDPGANAWLRGSVDVRVVRGGAAPSWTDRGPGKTRYGGRFADAGFERATRVVLSHLAIEAGAVLPWDVRAQAQLSVQPDIADNWQPWLVEAILRKEWGRDENGWGAQAGVMNVPFSLEHTGPAWTPEFTLSASALNSWLWDEISFAGIEGEWWRVTGNRVRISAMIGAGFGPDQLGRLLALRGWTLGDGLSGANADLPLPAPGARMDIFDERDDRPAAYSRISLGDEDERVAVTLGYFNNNGNEDVAGVWRTRVASVGVAFHPHARLDFLAQYLRGEAKVREPSNDSSVRAFYALLSYRHKRHRFTARYDDFRVRDLDGGVTSTQESGDGFTLAYLLQMGLRHRIGFEHIWLNSRRPTSLVAEPTQDGWQLSYRFRY